MRRLLTLCAVAASLLALAACGSSPGRSTGGAVAPSTANGPTTSRVVAPSSAWSAPDDPPGVRACAAIKRLNEVNAIKPDLDGALAAALDAERAGDSKIAAAGRELRAAASALREAGAAADLPTTLAVGTAGLHLETACITGGYYPRPS